MQPLDKIARMEYNYRMIYRPRSRRRYERSRNDWLHETLLVLYSARGKRWIEGK